jgi:predicted ATPase/DNA-binding SARP family transcriptional activator
LASLKLYTLGAPRIEIDGHPLQIERRKAVALLVYLAVTGQSHTREALATLLWPDYEQSRAYANLRRTLWELNHALGEGWIDADREQIAINPEGDTWLDVHAFQEGISTDIKQDQPEIEEAEARTSKLIESITLYQGVFLAGFTLKDSQAFDDWQFFQADTLRRQLTQALETLIDGLGLQDKLEEAIEYARQWVSLDPLSEHAHRRLMYLYAISGQRNAALRQYQICLQVLEEQLGVRPEAETNTLYERIRSGKFKQSEYRIFPLREKERYKKETVVEPSLPPQPTPFVGREEELQDITQLLQKPSCRLLSLVGPGGIGKTRLAIEAASRQAHSFRHGVFFIALAGLTSSQYIIPTIADVLKITPTPEASSPERQLLNYLKQREILLILDNFEQLLDGVVVLKDILATAPGVKILVTSRQRLNLREEWVMVVDGLRYPGADWFRTPEVEISAPIQVGEDGQISGYSALQLFLQSAKRAQVTFAVGEKDIPHVARICQLVQGLPLGIELAASWVKMLTCEEIADEIARSLDFLEAGWQDIPQRHKSIRAVFEQSWNLLPEMEKRVFMALSVFRGLFRREAAQQVAGAKLSVLSALVDKSLVQRASTERYELHELLRQYAAEKLADDPEEEQHTLQAYCGFYADFLHQRETDLKGARQFEALKEINEEIDNIRKAWRLALSENNIEALDRSVRSLFLYNMMRSSAEGIETADWAIQHFQAIKKDRQLDQSQQKILGYALSLQGRLYLNTNQWHRALERIREGIRVLEKTDAARETAVFKLETIPDVQGVDDDAAMQIYTDCLELFERYDDFWEIALTHFSMGDREHYLNRYASAKDYYHKCLSVLGEHGDRWLMTRCLLLLGDVTYRMGDDVEAKRIWQEGLQNVNETGESWNARDYLHQLSIVARERGEYEEARKSIQDSLNLSREIGDPRLIAEDLDNLGYAYYLLGDYITARNHYEESLKICKQTGDQLGMAYSLQNLGDIAQQEGNHLQAESYFNQSLPIFANAGEQFGEIIVLKKLGQTLCARNDYTKARDYFKQALEKAQNTSDFREMLDILIGWAEMLFNTDNSEQVVELLVLAHLHPSSSQAMKDRAERILKDLDNLLDNKAFEAAKERGKGRELEDVVNRLKKT